MKQNLQQFYLQTQHFLTSIDMGVGGMMAPRMFLTNTLE